MKHLQEAFFIELDTSSKLTIIEYAKLYKKHTQLAIEAQIKNGASEYQAKSMGNYYTIAVLSGFLANEAMLEKIMEVYEGLS